MFGGEPNSIAGEAHSGRLTGALRHDELGYPPSRRHTPVLMTENPLSDALEPDLATVFAALTSEQCRQVLRALEHPMTATEIAEGCDLPRSTVYGKLEQMVDAGLLLKHDGDDAARYSIDFEEVVVRNPDSDLELDVTPPSRSASEQLSELWGEVRTETRGD